MSANSDDAHKENYPPILKFVSSERAFLLAIVAPVSPYRVSPTRSVRASLGFAEEHFVQDFVEEVHSSGVPQEERVLHLLLHSPGGLEDSSFAIAKCLRRNFGRVVTYVPHIAASGATVIAMPSDEIVLGEISRLSPIDVQVYGPRGPRSALSVVRGVEEMNRRYARIREEDIPYPHKALIESVDLATWDEMRCFLLLSQGYATDLLKMGGFVPDKAEEISKQLVYGYPAHETVIDLEEARKVGLRAVSAAERKAPWGLMSEWYTRYLFTDSPIHHVRFALPERSHNNRAKPSRVRREKKG